MKKIKLAGTKQLKEIVLQCNDGYSESFESSGQLMDFLEEKYGKDIENESIDKDFIIFKKDNHNIAIALFKWLGTCEKCKKQDTTLSKTMDGTYLCDDCFDATAYPQQVATVLKDVLKRTATITNNKNGTKPFKVAMANGWNLTYKNLQDAINDCEKNKLYYKFNLTKQATNKKTYEITGGVSVDVQLDGSGVLHIEGKLPIIITKEQVDKLIDSNLKETASLNKKASLIGTVNAGYEIIDEELVEDDKNGVGKIYKVLGRATKDAVDKFVTWDWNEQSGFYWGHYINDEKKAIEDFKKR